METYDYIFVGAGVSSLATAVAIARVDPDRSIAIVDPRPRSTTDKRTFGYWFEDDSSLLPDGIGRRWNRWTVESADAHLTVELGEWSYETFDLDEWRREMLSELEHLCRLTWYTDRARRVAFFDPGVAQVLLEDGLPLHAAWVFDSRPPDPPDTNEPLMYQSFRGWKVATEQATFDPEAMFLMDFRERADVVQFAYVVPDDEHTAFVESVIIEATGTLDDEEFALEGLMADWTNGPYEVLATERGQTLLTTEPFDKWPDNRIVNIGTRGGAIRPSTGYAFARIHRDATAIANSLAITGQPERVAERRRDRFLDAVLLVLLRDQPARAPEVFMTLFSQVSTPRVLRLLDERATWTDILAVIWVMPWIAFLRAWWTYAFRK